MVKHCFKALSVNDHSLGFDLKTILFVRHKIMGKGISLLEQEQHLR